MILVRLDLQVRKETLEQRVRLDLQVTLVPQDQRDLQVTLGLQAQLDHKEIPEPQVPPGPKVRFYKFVIE